MMAAWKFLVLSFLLFGVIAAKTSADSAPEGFHDLPILSQPPDASDSSLQLELEQLKLKIYSLESSIQERTRELISKDESIKQMEKIIQERSGSITSMQRDIESLQRKESLNAKEQVGKAHARVGELEKQVEGLRKEIETQNQKKDMLEERANVAENRIQELNSKLESLQKINDDQKIRMRRTEHALQLAEEKVMTAKLEAASISIQLKEVEGAWLPPWLAVHLRNCQSYTMMHWNKHGRPIMNVAVQKALEKKALLERWAEPHAEAIQTKWSPFLKEKWLSLVIYVKPHVQSVTAKTVEMYHASKGAVLPHFFEVQQMIDPYYREAKDFCKPHIDQIASAARPHFDKAHIALKPHTKKLVRSYKRSIRLLTVYHRQVQGTIQKFLKHHELTKPYATNKLSWYLASAVFTLPVIGLVNICSAMFGKKKRRPNRSSHANHARRRARRAHTDK